MMVSLKTAIAKNRGELGSCFELVGKRFSLQYDQIEGWSVHRINQCIQWMCGFTSCKREQDLMRLGEVVTALQKEEQVDPFLYYRIQTLWLKLGGPLFDCPIEPIVYSYHGVKITLEVGTIETAKEVEAYVADVQKCRNNFLLLGKCMGPLPEIEVFQVTSSVNYRFDYIVCLSTPCRDVRKADLKPSYMNVIRKAKLKGVRILGFSLLGVGLGGYSVQESLTFLCKSLSAFNIILSDYFDEIKIFIEEKECYEAIYYWETIKKEVLEGDVEVDEMSSFRISSRSASKEFIPSLPGIVE